jgi:bromodomain-containing protein 8
MTETDQINGELSLILVASTINKLLKQFKGTQDSRADSRATFYLDKFVQALQRQVKEHTKFGNIPLIEKEELVEIIRKSKFASFVQVVNDKIVIDAQPGRYEETISEIVVSSTLIYSNLLVKQINDISTIYNHERPRMLEYENKKKEKEEEKDEEKEEEKDVEMKDEELEETVPENVPENVAENVPEETVPEEKLLDEVPEETEPIEITPIEITPIEITPITITPLEETPTEISPITVKPIIDGPTEGLLDIPVSTENHIARDVEVEDQESQAVPSQVIKEVNEKVDEIVNENLEENPIEFLVDSGVEDSIMEDEGLPLEKPDADILEGEENNDESDEGKNDEIDESKNDEIDEVTNENELDDKNIKKEVLIEKSDENSEKSDETSDKTSHISDKSGGSSDTVESKDIKPNQDTVATILPAKTQKSELVDPAPESNDLDKHKNTRKRSSSPSSFQQHKRFQNIAINLLTNIQEHRYSSPFLQAVAKKDALDYYDVIYQPKDLKNILKTVKLKSDPPEYHLVKQLERDIMLMFANCIMYNKSDDDLVQLTISMKNDVNKIFKMFEEAEREIQ